SVSGGRALLHPPGPARQLGGGERALCLPALSGRRPLCEVGIASGYSRVLPSLRRTPWAVLSTGALFRASKLAARTGATIPPLHCGEAAGIAHIPWYRPAHMNSPS